MTQTILDSYQLDQPISYIEEHLDENVDYQILEAKNKGLIREKKALFIFVQSHHDNAKEHNTFTEYLPYSTLCNGVLR